MLRQQKAYTMKIIITHHPGGQGEYLGEASFETDDERIKILAALSAAEIYRGEDNGRRYPGYESDDYDGMYIIENIAVIQQLAKTAKEKIEYIDMAV